MPCCGWESELHAGIQKGVKGGQLSIIMMEQQLGDFFAPDWLKKPETLMI